MTVPGFYIDGFLMEEFFLPVDERNRAMAIEQRERHTASVLNIREIAIYETLEIQNGQQWFSGNIGFRTTFDLVALNGGVSIPPGVTTLTLTTTSEPPLITFQNSLVPTPSFVSATSTTTKFYFNDPLLGVVFDNSVPAAQTVTITNNTGETLTQCFWVFNYYKT